MIKKKFIKSKQACQVTFELPKDIQAKDASLVGEFNGWDSSAHPLKKVKSVWKTTLELEQGRAPTLNY
ncbi:MAG TPA: isoamylase early set domain-containing protein [Anaerolineae bacterium]